MNTPVRSITYPARPLNGSRLSLSAIWRYANDGHNHSLELKYNGWRTLVHAPSSRMWNRYGDELSIQAEFKPALAILREEAARHNLEWLDCEALERRHNIGRGTLIVLDIIEPLLNYLDRMLARNIAFRPHHWDQPIEENTVYTTVPYYDQIERLWESLQQRNKELGATVYEGLVAKRNDSRYPIQLISPDRTFSGWIKHRFV